MKIKNLLIFIIIIGVFWICFQYLFRGKLPQPLGIEDVPNFLVQPSFQAEPRVFFNGNWKKLPRSQHNILSFDNKKLAVCGEGGVYIYDLIAGKIHYLYKRDWYPCQNIYFSDNNTLMVDGLFFDISKKTSIPEYPISENKNINETGSNFWSNDFKKVCNQDGSCAEIKNSKIILITNKGIKKETVINDAIVLVGYRQHSLFYATYHGSCMLPAETKLGMKLRIIKPARACLINHYLHVYDTKSGITQILLTDFRYDYETLIFF